MEVMLIIIYWFGRTEPDDHSRFVCSRFEWRAAALLPAVLQSALASS